jgi:hypothetical protein
MQLSKPPNPKATRKRLKKEILSDDFKKRKIFWKNIAETFLENFPYGKIFYGKFSTSHHYNNTTWTQTVGVRLPEQAVTSSFATHAHVFSAYPASFLPIQYRIKLQERAADHPPPSGGEL